MLDFKTLKFNQSDIFWGGFESLCGHPRRERTSLNLGPSSPDVHVANAPSSFPFSSLPLLNITVKADQQFWGGGGRGLGGSPMCDWATTAF